jgi:hypothetical protein
MSFHPQQVLVPLVMFLTPAPLATLSAYRQLHYPEESRQNNPQESILPQHLLSPSSGHLSYRATLT